jgi:Fur family ferric uptake transcriptional regulator
MSKSSDAVLDALRQRGYRMTPQRRAIVSEIMNTEGHIAPFRLVQRVKSKLPGVNDSTVYRTLDLLEEMGFLSHAHLEAGHAYHHADRHDHIHLICARCGSTTGVPAAEASEIRDQVAELTGFLPDFTHFAISGLCEKCRKKA